jgi:hypothetical protein
LIVNVARESQRPVTWLSLLDVPGMPEDGGAQTLARFEPVLNSGQRIAPQTTCRPIRLFINCGSPSSSRVSHRGSPRLTAHSMNNSYSTARRNFAIHSGKT